MIDVSVVIATRNRRPELMRTLAMLGDLPDRPPVLVVDNASSDGTAEAVRALRGVSLLRLDRNHGAAARNFGVREVRTPYVAFSDDDSWWEPGALTEAGRLLDASPRLGLIAARTLVGADRAPDPINDAMAHSPLPEAHGHPSVLGFLACASVLRTEAFRQVGGFNPLLFFVGEERLLAYDLAAAGWDLCYAPEIVAIHHPSTKRPVSRLRPELRNALLTAWLRRPLGLALRETARLGRRAITDPEARAALAEAVQRLGPAVRERRRLPGRVEQAARLIAGHP
jgi:GT2 family glycosyltransferase